MKSSEANSTIDQVLHRNLKSVRIRFKSKKLQNRIIRIEKLLLGISAVRRKEIGLAIGSSFGMQLPEHLTSPDDNRITEESEAEVEKVSVSDVVENESQQEELLSENLISDQKIPLSKSSQAVLSHYLQNPEKLFTVISDRRKASRSLSSLKLVVNDAIQDMPISIKNYLTGYIQSNISSTITAQCMQLQFGVLIKRKINFLLDQETDRKQRNILEKKFRTQLLVSTKQKTFWKFCGSINQMANSVGDSIIFLPDVIPPDSYRKISTKNLQSLITYLQEVLPKNTQDSSDK